MYIYIYTYIYIYIHIIRVSKSPLLGGRPGLGRRRALSTREEMRLDTSSPHYTSSLHEESRNPHVLTGRSGHTLRWGGQEFDPSPGRR